MRERLRYAFLMLVPLGVAALSSGVLSDEAWGGETQHDHFSDEGPTTVDGVRDYAEALAAQLRSDRASLDAIQRELERIQLPGTHVVSQIYTDLAAQHHSLSQMVSVLEKRAGTVSSLQLTADRYTLKQIDVELRSLTARIEGMKDLLRIR